MVAKRLCSIHSLDGRYGHFIHLSGYDNITDPGRTSKTRDPYGPYIIDKLTSGNNDTSTVYFALSTWNPYKKVLMEAELELKARANLQKRRH